MIASSETARIVKKLNVDTSELSGKICFTIDELCWQLKRGKRVEIAAYAREIFVAEFSKHDMTIKYGINEIKFKPTADGWLLEIVE